MELLKEHRGVKNPEKKGNEGKIEAGQNVSVMTSSEVDGSDMRNIDDGIQPYTSRGNTKRKTKVGC